jgi:hypothetical protein
VTGVTSEFARTGPLTIGGAVDATFPFQTGLRPEPPPGEEPTKIVPAGASPVLTGLPAANCEQLAGVAVEHACHDQSVELELDRNRGKAGTPR